MLLLVRTELTIGAHIEVVAAMDSRERERLAKRAPHAVNENGEAGARERPIRGTHLSAPNPQRGPRGRGK